MGIVVVLGGIFLTGRDGGTVRILLALGMAAASLGVADDMLSSARYKRGGAKPRPSWPGRAASPQAWCCWSILGHGLPAQHIPGFGLLSAPWVIAPLAILAIVASGHAVNLTDGLDGLAGGTALIAYGAFAIIAYAQRRRAHSTSTDSRRPDRIPLWYNINPARLFMGDTGSLALGSLLGGVALATGQIAALIPIGGVFAAVTLSVILQVAYFKRTGGKRMFRMAPLQHHFELLGWPIADRDALLDGRRGVCARGAGAGAVESRSHGARARKTQRALGDGDITTRW